MTHRCSDCGSDNCCCHRKPDSTKCAMCGGRGKCYQTDAGNFCSRQCEAQYLLKKVDYRTIHVNPKSVVLIKVPCSLSIDDVRRVVENLEELFYDATGMSISVVPEFSEEELYRAVDKAGLKTYLDMVQHVYDGLED